MNTDLDFLAREWGIFLPAGARFATDAEMALSRDFRGAMDAQPALTLTANSGVPAFLGTIVSPTILEVLFAPNKGAEIIGEEKRGDFSDHTVMFPIIEHTGETSSYGDHNMSGSSGANTNFPQRQVYLYQVITQWGELEMERMANARINWANELNRASILALDKFQNYTYHFGVSGLQNYGLLNDPNLVAAQQPGPKAYGAQAHGPWITSGVVTATANEVFTDIQSLYYALANQSNGLIEMTDRLKLVLSPQAAVGLTATNSFGVNVSDLLKKNFPNITVVTDPLYSTAAGNMVQLICESVMGQKTGFCAFNEKLRAHPVIREMSAFRQKKTQGTLGAVIQHPFAIAQMLGV